MFLNSEKRRIWPYIVTGFLVLFAGFGLVVYFFIKNTNPAKILSISFIQHQLERQVGAGHENLITAAPNLLGVDKPRTYLVLFLNNTEIRPGGGFIGSYAVVRFENGRPRILKVEGTETIDRLADKSLLPAPPSIIKDHLKVGRWYFRDSNWSPDFAASSQQTLALYKMENGTAADSIDGVIAVTTHVLEEALRQIGSLAIRGVEFTPENVVEKLEYEVEYGYKDKGLQFEDRKAILGELFHQIVVRLGSQALTHLGDYANLIDRLAREKHILAYAVNPELQKTFADLAWTGSVASSSTDYMLWVDANLAALKTDHALERSLKYEINPDGVGSFIATTTMTYHNTGKFDWRTTRYRTYARVYVPAGAELISTQGSMKWDRTIEPGKTDVGDDLGRRWFGTFISIEPGQTKTLSFTYRLPKTVAHAVAKKQYTLFIPKQLGTVATPLTLDLDFGTTISTARPAEETKNWGDSTYSLSTDLRVNREFNVLLK